MYLYKCLSGDAKYYYVSRFPLKMSCEVCIWLPVERLVRHSDSQHCSEVIEWSWRKFTKNDLVDNEALFVWKLFASFDVAYTDDVAVTEDKMVLEEASALEILVATGMSIDKIVELLYDNTPKNN